MADGNDETSPILKISHGPHCIRVWADGRVAAEPGVFVGEGSIVVENHIPAVLAAARANFVDQCAVAAITGMAAWPDGPHAARELARRAYVVGRAMLEEREREG